MSLGNCVICGKKAGTIYPLLPGSPAFCSQHHNPKDASPFGCDFSGPDDFDIPVDDFPIVIEHEYGFDPEVSLKKNRKSFTWISKAKDKYKIDQIDDNYLLNLINFLKRKIKTIPDLEYAPDMGLVDTEQEVYFWESLVEFLEEEQRRRLKKNE